MESLLSQKWEDLIAISNSTAMFSSPFCQIVYNSRGLSRSLKFLTQKGMQAIQEGRKEGQREERTTHLGPATPKENPMILSSTWISNNPTIAIIIHRNSSVCKPLNNPLNTEVGNLQMALPPKQQVKKCLRLILKKNLKVRNEVILCAMLRF